MYFCLLKLAPFAQLLLIMILNAHKMSYFQKTDILIQQKAWDFLRRKNLSQV